MLYKEHRHSNEKKFHWGIWKIEETVEELLNLLPDKEKYREQVEKFTSESRRKEWLAVRVLFYTLTGEVKEICYQRNGKPYLADDSARISISHTKGYAAVLISDTWKAGIDIEVYSERVHKIADKFIGEKENPFDVEKGKETYSLLLFWSAKETIFKCMDKTGVDFRRHLFVGSNPLHFDHGWVLGHEKRSAKKRHYVIHYLLEPDFVLTWTVT